RAHARTVRTIRRQRRDRLARRGARGPRPTRPAARFPPGIGWGKSRRRFLDPNRCDVRSADREVMDKRTRNEARRAIANDAAMLALALALEPVAPSSRLNDRLRASLARRGRYGVFAVRVARLFDIELDAASE